MSLTSAVRPRPRLRLATVLLLCGALFSGVVPAAAGATSAAHAPIATTATGTAPGDRSPAGQRLHQPRATEQLAAKKPRKRKKGRGFGTIALLLVVLVALIVIVVFARNRGRRGRD